MPYCTLCQKQVDQLHYQMEQWLLDTIRREHPQWVAEDGSCQPCLRYYDNLKDIRIDTPDG